MTEPHPGLFKKYDIRGRATGPDAPLNRDTAFVIGQAIATFVQRYENPPQRTIVVGRDNRLTSFDLQQALMAGMKRASAHVVDIGLVATPLVYWHAVQRGDVAGVMVTGSHLGADFNGFKMCVGRRSLHGWQIREMARVIEQRKFTRGEGQLEVDQSAYSRYIRDLVQRLPMGRSLSVVVDAGNGIGGLFIPRLLERWSHEMHGLYIEPDGTYPHHVPNPQDPANMVDLASVTTQFEADIGLAFDGDADRLGVVDDQGQLLSADRVLALLAQDMLQRQAGATVVVDLLTSQTVTEAVDAAGGTVHMAPTGHALVKEAMHERDALLAGEASGHLFFAEDYFGFDDAFFAAGRLLQLLSRSDRPLSALSAALPQYVTSPTYRPHCPEDAKQTVINGVKHKLASEGELIELDGFRLQLDRGWGLLRGSNTEEVLTLRFEGQTEDDVAQYRALFEAALRDYPMVGPLT